VWAIMLERPVGSSVVLYIETCMKIAGAERGGEWVVVVCMNPKSRGLEDIWHWSFL
jgi:hypothetical protein